MKNPTEQPPEQEVEREPQPLGFSWLTINNEEKRTEGINLTPDPEKSYAYVVFASPLPEEMTETEKATLQKYVGTDSQEYWYCGFGRFSLERAVVMQPNKQPSLTHLRERDLKHEKVTPLEITEEEVAAVIKNGRTIIYTGAGISVAAGTPDMKGLMAYLGIDRSKKVDDFIQTMMFSPDGMRAKLQSLQSSFFERTTPAHESLATIQKLTGVKIVTENLDLLGEAAGQNLIKRGEIVANFPDEVLKQLDCIVTVGLRADDSGLLWRYKQINLEGRFIALNIEPPPYLSKTDYYLEGDAQVTVPKIAELLTQ
jgi:hypothetical protein